MVIFYLKDIIPETITAYTADDSENYKTIVVFDCRGYQPVDFEPLVIVNY